jgi:hypothetical protein
MTETCALIKNGISVTIIDNKLTCGTSASGNVLHEVILTGTSTAAKISVSQSNLDVILSGVAISGTSKFSISNSDVRIITQSSSSIGTATESTTAVDCSDYSNLTFFSELGATLTTSAGNTGSGIGTSNTCHSIRFVNGTFNLKSGSSGAGIGSSYVGTAGGQSSVTNLEFLDGDFTVAGG